MKRTILGPCVLVLGIIAGSASAQDTGASPPSIPDATMGLSKTSVFDVPSPEPVVEGGGAPGSGSVLPRAYPGTPPLIPHRIAGFPPITREQNICLSCHQVKQKSEGGPTPVPESHFVDLRNAPGEVRGALVGARHNCTICHVPQTDAAPLVESRFGR